MLRLTARNVDSNVKLKVNITIFDQNECARLFRTKGANIAGTQVCAGGAKDKDSCRGDSGGPLMKQLPGRRANIWYMEGIVSFGPAVCGTEGVPGVYTRVSEYLEWIRVNMRS